MSATVKVKDLDKKKEIEGVKISFDKEEDYVAIQLHGPDGKPSGETYVEHKHLADKLVTKKLATVVKDAKIEVAKSQTQILNDD